MMTTLSQFKQRNSHIEIATRLMKPKFIQAQYEETFRFQLSLLAYPLDV